MNPPRPTPALPLKERMMARVTLWAETAVTLITLSGGSVALLLGQWLLGAVLGLVALGCVLRLRRLTRSRRR